VPLQRREKWRERKKGRNKGEKNGKRQVRVIKQRWDKKRKMES
jgi:hypothetical protein